MDTETRTATVARHPALLRCPACGYTIECSTSDVVRFARTMQWQRCCGQVMALFTHVARPQAPSHLRILDTGRCTGG